VISDLTHKTSDTVVNGKSETETPVLTNKMINSTDIDEMPSVHKASINLDELNEPEVKILLNKLTEEEDRVNATETVHHHHHHVQKGGLGMLPVP